MTFKKEAFGEWIDASEIMPSGPDNRKTILGE
jgi:hypothetical protein